MKTLRLTEESDRIRWDLDSDEKISPISPKHVGLSHLRKDPLPSSPINMTLEYVKEHGIWPRPPVTTGVESNEEEFDPDELGERPPLT